MSCRNRRWWQTVLEVLGSWAVFRAVFRAAFQAAFSAISRLIVPHAWSDNTDFAAPRGSSSYTVLPRSLNASVTYRKFSEWPANNRPSGLTKGAKRDRILPCVGLSK